MAAAMINNVLEKLHLTSHHEAPEEPSQEDYQKLLEKFTKAGQEQVFAFWDDLNSGEKGLLYQQLADIDPEYAPPRFESSQDRVRRRQTQA